MDVEQLRKHTAYAKSILLLPQSVWNEIDSSRLQFLRNVIEYLEIAVAHYMSTDNSDEYLKKIDEMITIVKSDMENNVSAATRIMMEELLTKVTTAAYTSAWAILSAIRIRGKIDPDISLYRDEDKVSVYFQWVSPQMSCYVNDDGSCQLILMSTDDHRSSSKITTKDLEMIIELILAHLPFSQSYECK